MPPKEPSALRKTFLAENPSFSELESEDEVKAIGKIEDIDITECEVWLLQCPKGLDVKSLEHEKLKVPGRTNLSDFEAVSVEFVDGKQQHSFAYYSKGRYDLRQLPIRGTIVLRNRLKAAENITAERIEECCPPSKRVPMPSNIRVRHPLLGFQYEDKLELSKEVAHRLQEADQASAQVLRDCLIRKMTEKSKMTERIKSLGTEPIPIESEEDDDDVQIVSEEVVTKKKRKHSETNQNDDSTKKKKKSKKSKRSDDDEVSKDLQWLQNL